MRIASPFPLGGGVSVVHQQLADAITGYQCYPYSAYLESIPWCLPNFGKAQADLVHAPLEFGHFYVKDDLPLVVTAHGFRLSADFKQYSSWVQKFYYGSILQKALKKSLDRADKVIAVSQCIAEEIQYFSNTRKEIVVIPNGIDFSLFYPAVRKEHDGIFRVLFCANWRVQKGIQWLPELVARLPKQVKLVVASGLKSGTEPRLEGDNIEWLGAVPREQMPNLYRKMDAFLCLSISEGYPLAVAEASACGLPILGWDIPALRSMSINSALFQIGDVDALLLAIQQTIEGKHDSRSPPNLKMTSLESCVDKYRQVFRAVI